MRPFIIYVKKQLSNDELNNKPAVCERNVAFVSKWAIIVLAWLNAASNKLSFCSADPANNCCHLSRWTVARGILYTSVRKGALTTRNLIMCLHFAHGWALPPISRQNLHDMASLVLVLGSHSVTKSTYCTSWPHQKRCFQAFCHRF